MAIKAYRQVSASEEVREMLEFRMKAERDEATRLSRARKDGREEGRLRGRLEAGRKMLAAGVDIQTVCGALELTPEQLELAP
jgi:predicted transposase/invertase (TIGR01784 family)